MTKEEKQMLKFKAKIEMCRRNFWFYCHCILPGVYKDDREYLKSWCNNLQEFYEDGEVQDSLVLNAPPRHCKSLTLQLFTSWLIGTNYLRGRKSVRIVVACYNQTLSVKFSTNVKNFINMKQQNNMRDISFSDVFPGCKIKKGFDTKEEWRIEGASESNFLTTSPGSSTTGFGCDILIIDDMYKSISELYSKVYEESLDTFVFTTLITRFENEKKTICGMTRWGKDDICGKLINSKKGKKIKVLKYKACDDNGKMLNESVLSLEEYNQIKETMAPDVFLANYQQEFISREGALYKNLKTYVRHRDLPDYDENGMMYQHPIYCVADLADKGTDWLCAIFYTIYNYNIYIVDVYFTDKQMSETEYEFAKKLLDNRCCYILGEGNNGGDTYIRNVQKIYKELGGSSCMFNTFYQRLNKESRILSQASWIEQHVFLPSDWNILYFDFYVAISDFQTDFKKNRHDDAADALTILGDCYNKIEDNFAFLSDI